MAERAHPEDPAFQDQWIWRRRVRGLVPWRVVRRSPWKQGLINRYTFCQQYIAGKTVLDVPCGVGWGTAMLRKTARLVGMDRDEEAIQYARNHYGRKAEFLVGDMSRLEFPEASFDVVTCLEGIEHVPPDIARQFLSEVARILKPRGIIILTSPLPDPNRPPNPYHEREYECEELLELVEPWFQTSYCQVHDSSGVEIVFYVGAVKGSQ